MAYKNKEDAARYARDWYKRNSKKHIALVAKTRAARLDASRNFIVEYLRRNPCVDCGEDDIVVLEFDHRDPTEKRFDVGRAIRSGNGVESIKAEIAKCDVRCANCHRRKTAKQFGHFRYLLSQDQADSIAG